MLLVFSPIADRAEVQCRAVLDFFSVMRSKTVAVETVFLSFCSDAKPECWRALFEGVIESGVSELRIQQDDVLRNVGPFKSLKRHATPAQLYPNLKSFRPHAPVLFDAETIRWTLQVINASALRELSLSKQSEKASWSSLLSHFKLPSLRVFTVEGGTLSMLSLSTFLLNHPALESLYIGADSDSELKTFVPPKLPARHQVLRCLRTLEAPLSYVVHLVGAAPWGTSSRLTDLRILPDVRNGFPFQPCVEHVLQKIADMEHLSWVSIEVPQAVGQCTAPWCAVPAPAGPDPYHSLTRLVISQSGVKDAHYLFSEHFMMTLPSLLRTFSRIEQLEVEEGAIDTEAEGSVNRQDTINAIVNAGSVLMSIEIKSGSHLPRALIHWPDRDERARAIAGPGNLP
ncbi:uncharacterized protein B0H18DRAFT_963550 [Fomitopsis serialis]|uniref:uncharacterized protein n=1 Tax=Fomitopsis serialis TaxID=139415 RepID=UPI00200821D2|nr:uncharacterized protein B0H18DRAFT_963550 [Neoantrodia serialis]KAH9910272.1 hypothetical protein B0H18DRAFT_963550 [Neoantrodia serialis]